MTAVAETTAAAALLEIEVCDAWFEYFEDTRWLGPIRYEEVEPCAWKTLVARLKAIESRRAAL